MGCLDSWRSWRALGAQLLRLSRLRWDPRTPVLPHVAMQARQHPRLVPAGEGKGGADGGGGALAPLFLLSRGCCGRAAHLALPALGEAAPLLVAVGRDWRFSSTLASASLCPCTIAEGCMRARVGMLVYLKSFHQMRHVWRQRGCRWQNSEYHGHPSSHVMPLHRCSACAAERLRSSGHAPSEQSWTMPWFDVSIE